MGYYAVNLLRLAVEIDGLATLFLATVAGLFLFVWPLCGVLLRVLLEYFVILYRVPGAMHQACFFTGRPICRMA